VEEPAFLIAVQRIVSGVEARCEPCGNYLDMHR
jgi:hypothetical protein